MKHQRTVKDDNMMRDGLMQHRDERRGRGHPRQRVILDWVVREPRRSRRTRRELNFPVFSSCGSKTGSLASTSNQSLSKSKNLGKSMVQEKEVLKAVKKRKRILEQQITKGPSKRKKEPAENINSHVQRVTVKSLHNQELQNLGKSKVQEKEVLKAVKHRKRVLEHQITKGPSKRTKEPAENINTHVQPVIVESLHNQELQNLGKCKVQEKEVLKAVIHRKRVLEHQIAKGPSKITKEPAENVNAHVQGVNIETLHNQELQISARTEAEAKKKKKRMTELAVMKAEIERIKEEQESINLKFSARHEEELKEIAKREKELQILKINIISLTKEHKKLMLLTKAHIQGEGLKHQAVCKSADTEVLEVSSARQEAVTFGETHVQEVSSGVTHAPKVVSTSLPAALDEDRFVLPDLNYPLL